MRDWDVVKLVGGAILFLFVMGTAVTLFYLWVAWLVENLS